MLRLRNVVKSYTNGRNKTVVLNDVNLDFNKNELVFILGTSGSGKSTLLNSIALNIDIDKGDIIYKDKVVNKLKRNNKDSYRNQVIGMIYQDYNLIDYMNVIDNVMLPSNRKISKNKVDNLLKELNIYDKKHVLVNKLSGGEKQRVAIARALINSPKIILADEPTGALDNMNSIRVMDILKKLSKNILVIVVSHDTELANRYADRIIRIDDGYVMNEECCQDITNSSDGWKIDSKGIRGISLFKLAFKNLWLKKGRTLFTALTIAIGLISMMIVMCLFSNFNLEIEKLEKEIVGNYPITVTNLEYRNEINKKDTNEIGIYKHDKYIHKNLITDKYINYLDEIKEIKYINYEYNILMPIVSDRYVFMNSDYFNSFNDLEYINDNYNILYGRNINNKNEALLYVDSNKMIDEELIKYFSIDIDKFSYNDILGREMKLIDNDNYFDCSNDYCYLNDVYKDMYMKSEYVLKIVGIVEIKESLDIGSGILYNDDIRRDFIGKNENSLIVKKQLENNYNILINDMKKEELLSYLGCHSLPNKLDIYVDNINNKEKVIDKLDEYNKKNKKIIYEDVMAESIKTVRDFVSMISFILIVFTGITEIVGILMINIVTGMRVVERKREIGIFRGLGARKRDVVKLFNIENTIIGIIAVIISFLVLIIISTPLNKVINSILEIDNLFKIDYYMVIIFLVINILIIRIIGSIPVRRANRQEIRECISSK